MKAPHEIQESLRDVLSDDDQALFGLRQDGELADKVRKRILAGVENSAHLLGESSGSPAVPLGNAQKRGDMEDRRPLVGLPSVMDRTADGELVLVFKSMEEANSFRDYMVESLGLAPEEIRTSHDYGDITVRMLPLSWMNRKGLLRKVRHLMKAGAMDEATARVVADVISEASEPLEEAAKDTPNKKNIDRAMGLIKRRWYSAPFAAERGGEFWYVMDNEGMALAATTNLEYPPLTFRSKREAQKVAKMANKVAGMDGSISEARKGKFEGDFMRWLNSLPASRYDDYYDLFTNILYGVKAGDSPDEIESTLYDMGAFRQDDIEWAMMGRGPLIQGGLMSRSGNKLRVTRKGNKFLHGSLSESALEEANMEPISPERAREIMMDAQDKWGDAWVHRMHKAMSKGEKAALMAWKNQLPRGTTKVVALQSIAKGRARNFFDMEEDVNTNESYEALRAELDGIRQSLDEANPYHDTSGRFTSDSDIRDSGKGSMSLRGLKPRKRKFKKKQYGKTERPCGRDARKKGQNRRCWDGKVPNYAK